MIVERRNDDANDQFPVGMRVLAVDDDPICLRLLETLLRKCQYHVTTTDRAIDALKLLRENKDKFDLVISDVHMPDMDGFKLLELVGLEMDLPVIMLSANGDTKLVMKGISHGACDYLLKPIRLEELKNIWQHVVRRKKFDKKDQNNSDNREKRSCPVGEGQKGSRTDDSDEDGRGSKRRKDQNEEDDEDTDENEDPSSQKKGRVVWSVDLHRKFVAAVNQLGFERAVPKKILELMNVEKLTRENVASHLQKYRLYLKRLSSVANQQANMVAALGGPDSAYLRMNAMNFHGFNGSGPFQNNSLRSLPPAGVLGRLNSPASLGIHGLSPSGMAPLGHGQMTRNPIADSSKLPLPRDQTGNIIQGMPTSLGFDQLQILHKKDLMGAGDFSSTNGETGLFSMSSGALDVNNVVNGQGNNTFHTLPSSSMLLQGHSQEIEGHGAIGQHFSAFSLTDPNRCNTNWSSGGQSYGVQSSSFASNDGYPTPPVTQAFISNNNVRSTALNGASESHISSNISRFDTMYEKVVLGNNRAENSGHISKPLWDNHKLDIVHHPDLTHSLMNPPLVTPSACSSTSGGDPTGMFFGGSSEFGVIGHSSMDSSIAGISGLDSTVNMGGFSVNGAGSLEDVVTSMVKRDPDSATPRKDTDVGVYSLRTCI